MQKFSMRQLDDAQMRQIVGGDKCGLLEDLTAGSCLVGFFVACIVGVAGDIWLC
jgi:hypothetical protein